VPTPMPGSLSAAGWGSVIVDGQARFSAINMDNPCLPAEQTAPAGTSPAANPFQPAGVLSPPDPVLCQHCGRTASNGISCQGSCVADSGY
jgi:hypothetical protein